MLPLRSCGLTAHARRKSFAGLAIGGAVIGCLCLALVQRDDRQSRGREHDFGRGATWRINQFTESNQSRVSLGVDKGGDVIAAWDSRRQDNSTYGIYARVLSADGSAGSAEIRVNQHWPGAQYAPAVAVDDGGGCWIAWTSYGQDGDGSAIVARRFERGLSDPAPERVINDAAEGLQHSVSLAAGSSGAAFAAWVHEADMSGSSVRGTLLGSCGNALSGEVAIGRLGERDSAPVVASDPRGGYVVVWSRADGSGVPAGLVARRLHQNGEPTGAEFWLDACSGIEPSIAIADDGRVFAAWLDPEETGYSVRARWFTPGGFPITPAVELSPASSGSSGGAAAAIHARNGLAVFHRASEGGDSVSLMGASVGLDAAVKPAHPLIAGHDDKSLQRLAVGTGGTKLAARRGFAIVGWEGDAGLDDRTGAHVTFAPLGDDTPVITGVALASSVGVSEQVAAPGPDDLPPVWDPAFRAQPPLESGPLGPGQFGFEGVPGTGWSPPDPEMAVGPGHLVLVVNGQIAFFDKSGSNTFRATLGNEGNPGFWESVGCGSFVFDPEVHYDRASGRFFAMASERAAGSYFCLAVSDDSDPNGAWHKYRLNVTALAGVDIDSPNLAVDAHTVYLTADFFSSGDRHLVYMLAKEPLLQGLPAPPGTSILITGSQSYGLAQKQSSASGGRGEDAQVLLQATELPSNSTLIIHAIRDALVSPTRVIHTLAVPAYQFPGTPPQQGSGVTMTLFEPRIWSCVQQRDSLWAVHHVRSATSGGRAVVRWYEIALNGWPMGSGVPAMRQWGEIDAGPGLHTYFPAIAVDDEGNAAVTFARSGTSEFIGMWRAVRRWNDPLGAFRPMQVVRASTSPFTAQARWGDYAGTQTDPMDGCTIWAHHEFTTSAAAWRTWVARYRVHARADLNEDCNLSSVDVATFQTLFELGDPRTDFNGDGLHTIADFGAFQQAFTLGL